MGATTSMTGPVTGGRRGWPFGAAAYDLGRYGYVEDEWFMEGEATTYRHNEDTGRSWDGRWSAAAAGKGAVPDTDARPPAGGRRAVQRDRRAHVEQRLARLRDPDRRDRGDLPGGVCLRRSRCATPRPRRLPGRSRAGVARVGSRPLRLLVHSRATTAGWDIYTQAARAVGPERSRQPDPLGGLPVERVLAFGVSQSATRLATYLNAIHPQERAVHGFLIDVYFGNGAPLEAPLSAARRLESGGGGQRRRRPHAAGNPPAARRPRRADLRGQLRDRVDPLRRRASTRHRQLPVLGGGRGCPRRDPARA